MEDFWPDKPKSTRWLYVLLAHAVRRLFPFIICGMQAIPVYRDERVMITFKKSVQTLREGFDIVIFPETDRPGHEYLNDIDAGFVDMGRLVKEKPVEFVPVYICPALRTISYGRPIAYDRGKDALENREIIASYLKETIRESAQALPQHRPVTYR